MDKPKILIVGTPKEEIPVALIEAIKNAKMPLIVIDKYEDIPNINDLYLSVLPDDLKEMLEDGHK